MSKIVKVRILSISDDRGVRTTRELIMREGGYEIVSITSDDLLSVSEIRKFDVAVICDSVRPARAMSVVDRLRRYNPDIRLVRVNPRVLRVDPFYDADAEVVSGTAVLLKSLRTLLDGNFMAAMRDSRGATPEQDRRLVATKSYAHARAL
jgi:CheY-like chemotaxis protein